MDTKNNATTEHNPPPLNHKAAKGSRIVGVIMAIIAIAFLIYWIYKKKTEMVENDTLGSTSSTIIKYSEPDTRIIGMYTLKKGDTIKVVMDGEYNHLMCHSAGTRENPHLYYRRNQNGKWTPQGDGSNIEGTGSWIELTGGDEPVEMLCDESK